MKEVITGALVLCVFVLVMAFVGWLAARIHASRGECTERGLVAVTYNDRIYCAPLGALETP